MIDAHGRQAWTGRRAASARRPAGTATMPIQGRIDAALLATPAIPHPYRIVEDQ
jgi:hypothetical protein